MLFEADNKNGFMHGFTPNYVKVKTAYDAELINTTLTTQLLSIDLDGDVLIGLNMEVLA